MREARTSEQALNACLSTALAKRFTSGWRMQAESTGVLSAQTAKQPDIVARPPGWRPVLIETEYHPAREVEEDAITRLGERYSPEFGGVPVDQAVAVRIPEALRSAEQKHLTELLDMPSSEEQAPRFEYCIHSLHSRDPGSTRRFPASGWISGSLDDLAGFIERAAVSQATVEAAAQQFADGVETAAALLNKTFADPSERSSYTSAGRAVAASLHQEAGMDVWRMACAIITNALVFNYSIASERGEILRPSADELRRSTDGLINHEKLLNTWASILEINYWPIFSVARDVLREVPAGVAAEIITHLNAVATDLLGLGATTTGDLSGQMFGTLIGDRKFLATFYTLPASAHLLAELAVTRLAPLNAAERVKSSECLKTALASLRFADLACGTGALLSAVYHRVGARLRRRGIDDADLHAKMMESVLIGADIMPAAVHLTASMLASVHPDTTFQQTCVHLLPYGERTGTAGEISVGSLDLLDSEFSPRPLWGSGRTAASGKGEIASETVCDHHSADLLIMNPPFTSPTNHARAEAAGVPVPSFAGFGTTDEEQRAMSDRLRKIYKSYPKSRAGHGNAGLASNFIDLAHSKVKPGGILALVLPVALTRGASWKSARSLIASQYSDVTVITIASAGSTERAFSADTGMAEALLVATRSCKDRARADDLVMWVNLNRRPQSIPEAVEIGKAIHSTGTNTRKGHLLIGEEQVGSFIQAPLDEGGCAQVKEVDVAEAALGLNSGTLTLPRLGQDCPIPMACLAELGKRGLVDRDIDGTNSDGSPRGPFDIHPLASGERATFPVLWGHDALRETRLVVGIDAQGRTREGCEKLAAKVWETASRLHFTRNFRLNSQPLAACLTPEKSIGGAAWPSFTLDNPGWEPLAVLWANSIFGLIGFWWLGTRQHQGRANITISRLPELPTLDPRRLSEKEIATAKGIFDYFASEEFLPANEAWNDPTRLALDEAIVLKILGLPKSVLDPLDALRWQWCCEPTVHGGKDTRPATPNPFSSI